MRTLVVAAEAAVLSEIAGALAAEGHTAVTVHTPIEAIAAYEDEPFPICLIDDAGGEALALCGALRALPRGRECALLVLGTADSPERLLAAVAAGANDYLSRPLESATLRARLRLAAQLAAERDAGRETEETLRTATERFDAIFANAAIGIAIVGLDGLVLESNPPLSEMLGYTAEELIGKHFADITYPEDIDADIQLYEELISGARDSYMIEKRYLRRDGSILWGRLAVSIVRGEEGPRVGVGMVENITDRKVAEAARAQLAAIVESSNDAIVGHTLDGTITSWNAGATHMYGYAPEEAIGRSINMLVAAAPDGAAETEDGGPHRIDVSESEHVTRDGRRIPVFLTFSAVRDESGEIAGVSMIARDISERRQAERELYDANEALERRVQELQQRTREITLLYELGDLLQACRSTDEAYSVVGQIGPQLFPDEGGELFVRRESHNLIEAVATWGITDDVERFRTQDDCWALRRGRMHHIDDTLSGLRCPHLPAPPPTAYTCVPISAQNESLGLLYIGTTAEAGLSSTQMQLAATVAEQIALTLSNLKMQETLRIQSIRDPLTNLYNRRYMEESLEREVRRAARSERPLAVIMADLDHFKNFNDSYGHEAGDTLLREVSRLLADHIRGGDIACRYGGEEFILILPEMGIEEARTRAEHVRAAVSRLNVHSRGRTLGHVTISLGVAGYPYHGGNSHAVLRAADAALYRAKAAGRDAVAVAE